MLLQQNSSQVYVTAEQYSYVPLANAEKKSSSITITISVLERKKDTTKSPRRGVGVINARPAQTKTICKGSQKRISDAANDQTPPDSATGGIHPPRRQRDFSGLLILQLNQSSSPTSAAPVVQIAARYVPPRVHTMIRPRFC